MSEDVYTIEQIRNILTPIFEQNNIRSAVLFGSYAGQNAGPQSDIDILVDSDLKGLDFVGLIEDAREAINKEMDMFDVSHIEEGSKIDSDIKKRGIMIYEK